MQNTQHPDDAAVDALATAMKAKLAKQRAKGYGGWDTDCTQQRLSDMLRTHMEKGDPVDVANFCAFLLAHGEAIAAAQQAVQAAVPDGYAVVSVEKINAAIQRARVFDDGGDGADPESARSVVTLLRDILTAATAHPAEGMQAQAEPFMWAIQEPGGSAYMDENCVSTSRGIVEAEVDGLNLGLDADDEPYKVVPVYLAATQPAEGAPAQEVSAEKITPDEWREVVHSFWIRNSRRPLIDDAEFLNAIGDVAVRKYAATHPTQQGMDARATRYEVKGLTVECRGNGKWAVVDGYNVLNRYGEWKFEPSPSSRTDEWLALCRFDSAQEAIAAAQAKQGGAA